MERIHSHVDVRLMLLLDLRLRQLISERGFVLLSFLERLLRKLELPTFDGFNSCRSEHWMPGEHGYRRGNAVAVENELQPHLALDMRCTCKRRIFRLAGRFQDWIRRHALCGEKPARQHEHRQ